MWEPLIFININIFTTEDYSPATHFTIQHGCFCIFHACKLKRIYDYFPGGMVAHWVGSSSAVTSQHEGSQFES